MEFEASPPATQPILSQTSQPFFTLSQETITPTVPQVWGRIYHIYTPVTCLDLTDDRYFIGRSREADIQLDIPECSKLHCSFTKPQKDLDTCYLTDESVNGTFVNSLKLKKGEKKVLNHGDKIEIRYNHVFIYHLKEQEDKDLEELDKSSGFDAINALYLFSKKLGVGTYATVRRAIHRATGKMYACKIIAKVQSRAFRYCKDLKTLEKVPEIQIMRNLNHPNIVKVYDLHQTHTHVFIFLQLVEGGELFEYLATKRKIPEKDCKFWMYQLFRTLEFLHDHNIAHRDIKPENVLLESFSTNSKLILGDFGLAKSVPMSASKMTSLCGTLNYAAPEVLQVTTANTGGYSNIADSWSLGVMLYFLISGHLPFEGANDSATRTAICYQPLSFDKSKEWDKVSDECLDLIRGLLEKDPEKRTPVKKALKHPWITTDRETLERMYKNITKHER